MKHKAWGLYAYATGLALIPHRVRLGANQTKMP